MSVGQVLLTTEHLQLAEEVACRRYLASRALGCDPDKYGKPSADQLWLDKLGCLAELGYCLWKGVPWEGRVNNFKEADVGRKTQVRGAHGHGRNLILRPDDPDDHYYVLVTVTGNLCKVHGWVKGAEGKRIGKPFHIDGRPDCTLVRQNQLHKQFS